MNATKSVLIFSSVLLAACANTRKQTVASENQTTTQQEQTTQNKDLRQVSGEILMIKQVEVRNANTKNTVVMIKTDKNNRRLVVDLGPTEALPTSEFTLGRKIQVEGQPVQVRDQRFLVANRIKVGGRVIDVSRQSQQVQRES